MNLNRGLPRVSDLRRSERENASEYQKDSHQQTYRMHSEDTGPSRHGSPPLVSVTTSPDGGLTLRETLLLGLAVVVMSLSVILAMVLLSFPSSQSATSRSTCALTVTTETIGRTLIITSDTRDGCTMREAGETGK